MMKIFYIIITTIWLCGTVDRVAADSFKDQMAFWESQAFLCQDTGQPFPSKERVPDASDPSRCEDGDMTLFNGLLCAAGDSRGCNGVKLAQDTNGRWWRSPRRKGMEAPLHDVSFSPDMGLGVLHYAVQSADANGFRNWLSWIDRSRPCIAELAGNCFVKGWPRVCTDDTKDKRCTFRPGTCNQLEIVGRHMSVPEGEICRKVLQSLGIRADYILPTTELAASNALVNESGYPMHLAAAEIFLLERLGLTSVYTRAGAVALALRDSNNPFFLYLAEGPTQKVKDMVILQCPSPQMPSRSKTQWTWERASSEKAWLDSMYWDCIFMGKLLGY
jgi:hypothetical protein